MTSRVVKNRLSVEYNELTDILTIEGKDYSGDLFRYFAEAFGPTDDRVFKIVEGRDGIVTVSVIKDRIISAEFNRRESNT